MWDVGGTAPSPTSPVQLIANVVPLNQAQFVFDAMLNGWGDQQFSRGLKPQTVNVRRQIIVRFQKFTDAHPWQWRPGDLEAFSVELDSGARPLAKTTLRTYQRTVWQFCAFIH